MDDADRKRFFAKTKRATEIRPGMVTPCLEWQACRLPDGYGQIWIKGKLRRAHRVAWEDKHGPIPDGLHALHRYDNPPCVDDEHLFLGTQVDNNADCRAKGRGVVPPPIHGDAHPSRTHPECLARGEKHGARLHPDRLARGNQNGSAKLTEANVISIFELHRTGWSQRRIAEAFGVCQQQISKILSRKFWAHLVLEDPSV